MKNTSKTINICAIIVTYNRKQLLMRCLNAVKHQTRRPDTILIIDNASSDGTFEFLSEHNVINSLSIETNRLRDVSIGNIKILYYRLSSNIGGAGGFYTGLKLAHESKNFDYYWLMDDDGYPSLDCLEKQIPYIEQYKYVMPVSIDIDNRRNLSWSTRKRNGDKTLSYSELLKDWGEVMPFIFPFNGSLMHNDLVENVGYVDPRLFIWGDDYDHYFRCINAGYCPITVLTAIYFHPVNRAPIVKIFFGKIPVPYVNSELRMLCLIRNWTYIYKKNRKFGKLVKHFLAYSWLFLITRNLDLKGYYFYLCSMIDGIRENFTRHTKYLK